MRQSRKFCQRGSTISCVVFFVFFFFFFFWGGGCVFLVDEGWVDPNSTLSGPSLARSLAC